MGVVPLIQSAEEFVRLRTSEFPEDYRRASHEAATDDVWQDVIDRFPGMRIWVAHNKTVAPAFLRILADDPDPTVRETVAATRRTQPEVLIRLAKDSEPRVRQAVAYNAKAPLDALRLLANDTWNLISDRARERLERIERLAKSDD